jgi:hypothetical protein
MWQSSVRAVDLDRHAPLLVQRRYGRIIAEDGALRSIQFRPFSRRVTIIEHQLLGQRFHCKRSGNLAWIDYNHPRRHGDFLSVAYFVSTRDASLATCHSAIAALETIARLKGCHAILCDAANSRITEVLLRRYGFEPHAPMRWHCNYIKRLETVQSHTCQAGEVLARLC